MGVLRAEPARLGAASRAVGSAWRAYDWQLSVYALMLMTFGLVMAYSNSVHDGTSPFSWGTTFTRGGAWAVIAVGVFVAATVFDYKWLKTFAWPLYAVNLGLLGLSLLIGDGVGNSSRWVTIPIIGLQFQFSELAKILMIVVIARYLSAREDRLDSLSTILGAGLLMAPAVALVMLQPDLGTSLVLAAILAGMLFMSGASLRWLAVLGAAAVALVPVAWNLVLHDYQKARLLSFLDPSADPQGSGYHLLQAQIAVGSGGLLGRGLTNSTQGQLDYLPVQTTDFVFAILAEELGFLGALVVFLLFVALLWRVLTSAWRARDPFGTLFGAGLASMILFQLAVNVGMVIGIMPITGIPLPFITHGGASLITLALGLGILQSINIRQARAEW
jgi:rod shape determining protein RodA